MTPSPEPRELREALPHLITILYLLRERCVEAELEPQPYLGNTIITLNEIATVLETIGHILVSDEAHDLADRNPSWFMDAANVVERIADGIFIGLTRFIVLHHHRLLTLYGDGLSDAGFRTDVVHGKVLEPGLFSKEAVHTQNGTPRLCFSSRSSFACFGLGRSDMIRVPTVVSQKRFRPVVEPRDVGCLQGRLR